VPAGFDRTVAEGRVASWKADDAWPVVFTTNTEIRKQVQAELAEYGYASAEDAGLTVLVTGMPVEAAP
jgi:hypothetical protein